MADKRKVSLPECTSLLSCSCTRMSVTAAMFCRALHLGMGTNVETSQDGPIDESDSNLLVGECIAEPVLVHVNK